MFVNPLLLYLLNGIEIVEVFGLHKPRLVLVETRCLLPFIGWKDVPMSVHHHHIVKCVLDDVNAIIALCCALDEVVKSGFIICERHITHFK